MSSSHDDTPPTVRADHPPSPAASGTGGLGSGASTIPTQDLSTDKLIHSAPRSPFNGVDVPSLGGIPLLAKLGQGGMGAVYYGIHPRLHQEVAVKVLPFEMAEKNPGAIERFHREARLAARVKSPHLVGVMDVNQESGLTYLVMEYVAGASAQGHLREVVKTGAAGLAEGEALDICIAACTGLAAAHAKGIIHRDVKPDNILIPRDENTGVLQFHGAKLADLGLARSESIEFSSLTLKDAGMGTPGYMPPEQFADAKSCRKPADVFAMGATLYALLSGAAPFAGTQLYAILKATIESPHTPIQELRSDVSAPTAELLDRCLAKEPAQRYVDGSALLAALSVCRAAVARPEQARAAVAQVSGLLNAKEVGQTVIETNTPIPPTSVVRIGTARTEPRPIQMVARSAVARTTTRTSRTAAICAALLLIAALAVGVFFAARALVPKPDVKLGSAKELVLDLGGEQSIKLALIPAGQFTMGSPATETGRQTDETPHQVSLTHPFYMATTHVTVAQFREFAKSGYRTDAEKEGTGWGEKADGNYGPVNGLYWEKPGIPTGENHPVVQVSWNDAKAFCAWLSAKTGRIVRLPTDAEFEYANRAGTQTAYQWGNNPDDGKGWANCADQSLKTKFPNATVFSWDDGYVYTSPVGSFKPNAFGLFDMNGNVLNWCEDKYAAKYYDGRPNPDVNPQGPASGDEFTSAFDNKKYEARVLRGGSWFSGPASCRSAFRSFSAPVFRSINVGFRIVVLGLDFQPP